MEKAAKTRIFLIALGLSLWVLAGYLTLVYSTTIYDANHSYPISRHPYASEGFLLSAAGMVLTHYGLRYKRSNVKAPQTTPKE
jgi:hypothetical protein